MKGVIGVKKGDYDVHIKQSAQLDAFLVPYSLNVFQCDDFAS